MPPRKHGTVWSAEPHTVAKIAILGSYLHAWFNIMGRTQRSAPILYVDGFAGPGRYSNGVSGSPLAALDAATASLQACGDKWIAGPIVGAFIERDAGRFNELKRNVASFANEPNLQIRLFADDFEIGIEKLRSEYPRSFSGNPLFVFIDPFGPTSVRFSVVADILKSRTAETLIYFDADAIGRIFSAGEDAGASSVLPPLFGSDRWKAMLKQGSRARDLASNALEAYKQDLLDLANVNYVFSFELRKKALADYFLVFASQHPKGLKKMKGAMKSMDQTGEYQFSDAHVGRARLFRFDNPEDFFEPLLHKFQAQTVTLHEIEKFVLNQTPFDSVVPMLKPLEGRGDIEVVSPHARRRKGTFPSDKVRLIRFRGM